MTREEEIWNAINNLQIGAYNEDDQLDNDEYDGNDLQNAFYTGAKWADNHPKSPWISVKDDLPYRHFELLEPIPTENFKGETISVLVIDNKGYSWFDYMVLYKNIWKWKYLESEPSYWMPIPELPKEQKIKL